MQLDGPGACRQHRDVLRFLLKFRLRGGVTKLVAEQFKNDLLLLQACRFRSPVMSAISGVGK
jgi:hypothetical protein